MVHCGLRFSILLASVKHKRIGASLTGQRVSTGPTSQCVVALVAGQNVGRAVASASNIARGAYQQQVLKATA
jgi:hypothetical protein